MKYSLVIVLLVVFASSCYKDIDGLDYNILDDETISIFQFNGHQTQKVGVSWDVRLYFSSIYSQLNPEQQERIEGIQLFKNGAQRAVMNPVTQQAYFDAVSKTVCYQLAFKTKNGGFSRKSEQYCIQL